MRFAIDTIDDAGNSRIYVGEPVELADNHLRIRLRNGELDIAINRITDWFQIDRQEKGDRGQLFAANAR